jgi:hypothetical protein
MLVTNTTERFPLEQVPDFSPSPVVTDSHGYGMNDLVYRYRLEPVKDPTQKDVVTEVYEVKTLTFDFEGKHTMEISRTRMSSTTNHFELKNNWLPSTNSLPEPKSVLFFSPTGN